MISPALMLAFFWLQTPAQAAQTTPSAHTTHSTHHTTASTAATVDATKPKGPKTAAELQADLNTALHAEPFTGDSVRLALAGEQVTLEGVVHSAEHKGLVTREVRKVAEKDGWDRVHIANKLTVQLPGSA